MKKLLFLLLFSVASYGQAEYEKIAITANTQDNSALKVSVQSSSNEINWKYIKDFQKEKEYLSTGLIKSGVISINGDNTKYNVSAGIGIITNFDDPENPTSTIVNFPAVVAKTPSYLTTSNITYVAINSSGTVTESATPFTPEQRRTLIILGAVIHSNLTNINVVNNISAPTNASTNQLHDLMEAIGALNLSGNKFGPNNANLLMNKSAGTIFKLGSNFVNDWKNPHVLGQGALTGLTFRYRTQNGTEGADVTSINPNVYDLNNVLTAVPSNRYSIQTITLFQSGLVRVQYGQETYGSLSEAEAAISTRSYAVESNIALNGITRAYLLVKEGSTSLTNTANAKFVDAGKFGSITSGGGAITLASIIAALGYTPENDANKQNSLATDGSGVKYPTVDAVNTKVSNIDNTSDLNKTISTATQTALNLKENTANKNIANGYAGLGSDGKLISSQLPSITITDTFVVGSQSAMLSLVAETGDVAVRTDVNKSFILQGDTPSDLADWQELLTPTSTVSSVFGRTGAVTANSGDYTADQISETASRKFQSLEQKTYNDATSSIQTQLNGKVSLTGSETIAGAKTFTSTPSFDNNIYLKHLSSWSTPAGYTVIGGRTDGFLLSASSTKTALIGLGNLTQAWTYDFPNKSGTFAMTSDVPTISGTTNYVTKFTGASAIGNSLIYDNGTNVGIGQSSPFNKLTIEYPSAVVGNSSADGVAFQTSNTGDYIQFLTNLGNYSSIQAGIRGSITGRNLLLNPNGGNVGIGSVTPDQKLTVNDVVTNEIASFRGLSNSVPYQILGNVNVGDYWRGVFTGHNIVTNATTGKPSLRTAGFRASAIGYSADSGQGYMGFFTTNSTTANTDLSERMRITEGGNVGIGILSPAQKLDVLGISRISNTTPALQLFNTTSGDNWATLQAEADAGTGGKMVFYTKRNGNSENAKMTITESGQVRIGTTLPLIFSNDLTEPSLVNGIYSTTDNTGYGFAIGKMVSGVKTKQLTINDANNATFIGSVTASSFIKSGGTSSQYLMADGSVKTGPGSYKVYTALLNQTGTNAPTATVLENTLGGTIVWSYVSIGQYRGTLTGAFLSNKTVVFLTNVYGKYFLTGGRENDNSVMIGTQAPNGGSTNGDLSNSSIEIRVYN